MAHPADVEMFKDPNIIHMMRDYANDGYTPNQAVKFIYDANYSALFNKPGMDDQKPKRKQLILDDIDTAKRHNNDRTIAAMSKDPLFKPMIYRLGIELNSVEKVLDIIHDSNFTVAMINDPTIRAAIELMQEDEVAVKKIFDTIRKSKMGMLVAVKELHKKSAKKSSKKKSAKKSPKKKSAKKPIKKKSSKKSLKKKSKK
jgi:hypothetical protein